MSNRAGIEEHDGLSGVAAVAEPPIVRDESSGFWIVNGYADVRELANAWDAFASVSHDYLWARNGRIRSAAVSDIFTRSGYEPVDALVAVDPPLHRFHRAAISTALSRAQIAACEPMIASVVDALIDAFERREAVEFCAEFADQLPLRVLIRMLGLGDEMLQSVARWCKAIFQVSNLENPLEVQAEAADHLVAMQDHFSALFATAEDPENRAPLLRDIAEATGADGQRLPLGERLMILMQTMVAGIDTTASALASCALRLARDAELQAGLRAAPERIPTFVDECLRLDAPVQSVIRRATREVTLHGCRIQADEIVVLRWAAANLDPSRFACPHALDAARKNAHQHVSFGYGVHFCPGRHLAESAARLTIERLLARCRELHVLPVEDAVAHFPKQSTYTLRQLWLGFVAAPAHGA